MKPNFQIHALGHVSFTQFYYLVKRGGRNFVITLTAKQHGQKQLEALASYAEWKKLYSPTFHPHEHGLKLHELVSDSLFEESRKKGPFNPKILRGLGVWRDGDSILVNTGNMIISNDGKAVPLSQYQSKTGHYYVSGNGNRSTLPLPSDEESSSAIGEQLLALFRCSTWQDGELYTAEIAPKLLTGWIAAAYLTGVLSWRTHVYLTGSKGTGKSALTKLCSDILGNGLAHDVQIGTTEPGLRQTLGHEACPVIFDEFEGDVGKNIQILELLRASTSDDSSEVLKGGASGTPQSYKPMIMALVAGIRVNLQDEANRSRFVTLELGQIRPNQERQFLMSQAKQNSGRYFKRMLNRYSEFCSSLAVFKHSLHESRYDARHCDLLGTLLAGYWTLTHDLAVTSEEAASEVTLLKHPDDAISDERECLNHLLTKPMKVDDERLTIASAIKRVRSGIENSKIKDNTTIVHYEQIENELAIHGVRVIQKGDTWYVLVANGGQGIRRIYENTRWIGGKAHQDALRRLGGAPEKPYRFAETPSRCTKLLWNVVFPRVEDEAE